MHMDPYWFHGGFPPMGFPGEYSLTKSCGDRHDFQKSQPACHHLPTGNLMVILGYAWPSASTSALVSHISAGACCPCSAKARLNVALSTGLVPDSRCIQRLAFLSDDLTPALMNLAHQQCPPAQNLITCVQCGLAPTLQTSSFSTLHRLNLSPTMPSKLLVSWGSCPAPNAHQELPNIGHLCLQHYLPLHSRLLPDICPLARRAWCQHSRQGDPCQGSCLTSVRSRQLQHPLSLSAGMPLLPALRSHHSLHTAEPSLTLVAQ